jgi:ubiquinone/menaquinone biosynthesis C-methylase UbiE
VESGQVTRTEVPEAFDEVAERYDLMVGMSPGYHAQLRASADALLDAIHEASPDAIPEAIPDPAAAPVGGESASPAGPLRLLDLGCGSGASTRALVAAVLRHAVPEGRPVGRPAAVLAVDGSPGMLQAACSKAWPSWVGFAEGRAEALAHQPELAAAREAGGLDGVFAAYLVRNVPDRDAVIAAIRDELRPGGVLAVHDYSVRGQPAAVALWTAMCWAIIIPLGWMTSRNTRLYRYLWRSVLEMDSVAELEARLRRAGLVDVTTLHAGGWQRGIVHTVVGRRPADA